MSKHLIILLSEENYQQALEVARSFNGPDELPVTKANCHDCGSPGYVNTSTYGEAILTDLADMEYEALCEPCSVAKHGKGLLDQVLTINESAWSDLQQTGVASRELVAMLLKTQGLAVVIDLPDDHEFFRLCNELACHFTGSKNANIRPSILRYYFRHRREQDIFGG